MWHALVAVWPIFAVLYFFALVALVVDVVCAPEYPADYDREPSRLDRMDGRR
jgi:hypothetical protein